MDGTVLVVDDELVARVITARMLKAAGYRVREAASAATALTLLRSGPKPSLILADINMPGMNGVDFALEVCRSWTGLPIVLMSGYAPQEQLSGLSVLFLAKPFDQDALLRVVDAALKDSPSTRWYRLNRTG